MHTRTHTSTRRIKSRYVAYNYLTDIIYEVSSRIHCSVQLALFNKQLTNDVLLVMGFVGGCLWMQGVGGLTYIDFRLTLLLILIINFFNI